MLLAWVNWEFKAFVNAEQSFSMYIPYADTTMSNVDAEHMGETKSAHCEWTALYSASPVRFAMFSPDAKFVVAQIWFMSPAMSSVPNVLNDWLFADDNTSRIPVSFAAESDVSLADSAANSPSDAVSMALTSSAVLGITSIFKL